MKKGYSLLISGSLPKVCFFVLPSSPHLSYVQFFRHHLYDLNNKLIKMDCLVRFRH